MVLVLGAGLPSLPNELRHHTTAEVARDLRTYPFREGHMACASNTTCECDQGWGGKACRDELCEGGCVHGKCLQGPACTCEVWAVCKLHPSLKAPPSFQSLILKKYIYI